MTTLSQTQRAQLVSALSNRRNLQAWGMFGVDMDPHREAGERTAEEEIKEAFGSEKIASRASIIDDLTLTEGLDADAKRGIRDILKRVLSDNLTSDWLGGRGVFASDQKADQPQGYAGTITPNLAQDDDNTLAAKARQFVELGLKDFEYFSKHGRGPSELDAVLNSAPVLSHSWFNSPDAKRIHQESIDLFGGELFVGDAPPQKRAETTTEDRARMDEAIKGKLEHRRDIKSLAQFRPNVAYTPSRTAP